jgi:hypothetical protein
MNDSKANDIIKIFKVREPIFFGLTDKQTTYSKLDTVGVWHHQQYFSNQFIMHFDFYNN